MPVSCLWFSTNYLPVSTGYCFGDSGKIVLQSPGEKLADLCVRRFFSISDQVRLEFRGEPDPFITDGPGAAGATTSTVIPQRQIQFAMKLQFEPTENITPAWDPRKPAPGWHSQIEIAWNARRTQV